MDDTYEIESDGKVHVFKVYKNTTEPCPQCGVPACGREDILWSESNGQRLSLIFDGGYFDMARDEYFEKEVNETNYRALPKFMKEWNELRGWNECWEFDGYELDIEDFILSVESLRKCEMGKWIKEEDIEDMLFLANDAKSNGGTLKIVRG